MTHFYALQIIEDAKGGITVKGLTMAVAGTEEEAMNLFFEGETNRAIAEHQVCAYLCVCVCVCVCVCYLSVSV